ncbi:MAG TPA: TonB-dependent receptor [Sphingomonas sp.]|nr:TonB-dependent receptor [Sphingomonas sp.]
MRIFHKAAMFLVSASALSLSAPSLAAPPASDSGHRTGTANEGGSSPAPAGDAPLPPAPGDQEIIVTGSRIARSTFETPTPVTSISQRQLEAKAATTVIDLLRDIPVLRPNRNNGSATDVGASTFNIRSLGATRTLVLIDGQRVLNSSPTGGFDLNLLPAPLIKRMEIVTGGASSVYGSDAVTGVVNVFLDGDLTGGKADAQFDISGHGDTKTYSASGAVGTHFAENRGRIVAAASYFNRPDVLYQGSRGWGSRGVTLIPNPGYTATNGQYRQFLMPGATLSSMTYGGVITSAGPLKNIQFGEGGSQSALIPGTYVSSVWMVGGGGLMLQPQFGVLVPSSERINAFSRLSYDLATDLEAHADILFARAKQNQTNLYNYNNGDILIKQDNAFLPNNIKQIMATNNIQSFSLGRLNPELGINNNTTVNSYIRFSGGLKGKLSDNWQWDGNLNYTNALYNNHSLHNRNNSRWTAALDSVMGPNGQPICRSTLTNPGNGCIAANPFGINSVSPDAANYVTGTSWIRARSTFFDANFNATGTLFSTWAGPVKAALGGEYRKETVNFTSDPVSAVNGWRQASSAPYHGRVNVKEAYVEFGVPLARNAFFARRLDLDLAGRHVDYSTSGGTNVWKIGLNWTLDDRLRLRGTYSRDFRAPTINELFAATTVRQGAVVVDRTNNQSVVVATAAGGNRLLKPEAAHTLTAGAVLRPTANLQFSVDFFDIKLDGAITTLGAQDVIDRCATGATAFCSNVQRNASGLITLVQTTAFNAQTLKTRGLDFEGSWHFPLSGLVSSWDGEIGVAQIATYVDRLLTVSNTTVVNTAGQVTGGLATPKWREATTISYTNGPLQLRVLGNLVGGGRFDNNYGPRDLSPDSFAGRYYVDVSAQYDLTKQIQIYAKVENLFDAPPALAAGNTPIRAGATDSTGFYDLIGRNFGVGVRYRW